MFQANCTRSCLAARAISVSALLLAAPVALGAQMPVADAGTPADAAAVAHHQADVLIARCSTADWPQVAVLLEQAATARAPEDLAAIDERVTAAQLFYFTGSLQRAQANLESAARTATAGQRLYDAAEFLRRAAIVAQQRGLTIDAIEYARGAELLACSSRQLTPQCARIRAGIVWGPLHAGSADT